MTDDQIRTAYARATGITAVMGELQMTQARAFIRTIFDMAEPAGYLDPDGTLHLEEWEASADCEEVFRRML